MTKTRQIKIIASQVADQVNSMSHKGHISEFLERMETMVQLLELDIYEFIDELKKKTNLQEKLF